MELKTARFTLLLDPNKKAAFEQLCARQDLTPSQVVRQLIRDYMAQHGVSYVGSGAVTDTAAPDSDTPPAKPPSTHSRQPSARKTTSRKKA
jgi:hypothetical protein